MRFVKVKLYENIEGHRAGTVIDARAGKASNWVEMGMAVYWPIEEDDKPEPKAKRVKAGATRNKAVKQTTGTTKSDGETQSAASEDPFDF